MTAPDGNPGSLAALVGTSVADLRRIVAGLTERGWTIAAAESLTGGLLTAVLTEIPGSSAVVRGGFVVYATDLKHVLAGVDASLLATEGAVHPRVAAELATGARERCGAVLGLGLTGVAGPDPQDGRPTGTFHVALVGPDRHATPVVVTGAADDLAPTDVDPVVSRARVRALAVRAALDLVTAAMGVDPVGGPPRPTRG